MQKHVRLYRKKEGIVEGQSMTQLWLLDYSISPGNIYIPFGGQAESLVEACILFSLSTLAILDQ